MIKRSSVQFSKHGTNQTHYEQDHKVENNLEWFVEKRFKNANVLKFNFLQWLHFSTTHLRVHLASNPTSF